MWNVYAYFFSIISLTTIGQTSEVIKLHLYSPTSKPKETGNSQVLGQQKTCRMPYCVNINLLCVFLSPMIGAMHYLGYDAAYEMTHCLPSSAVSIQILEFGVYRFMLSTCQNMGTNRNYLLLEGINQYNPSTQKCAYQTNCYSWTLSICLLLDINAYIYNLLGSCCQGDGCWCAKRWNASLEVRHVRLLGVSWQGWPGMLPHLSFLTLVVSRSNWLV